MKNILTCKSCGEENPFYSLVCQNCNSYLRDKVVNIDLWNIIGRLIENPLNAFKTIIHSEHKNFVVSIIIFAAIKFFIDSLFFLTLQKREDTISNTFILNILIVLITLSVILSLYSLLITIITSKTEARTRFYDNLAILTYSLTPQAIALCIIFPIEVVVFGSYTFSGNPSPFNIKPLPAYVLTGFEFLAMIASIYLAIIGLYCQTRSKLYGFLGGIIFYFLVFLSLLISTNFIG